MDIFSAQQVSGDRFVLARTDGRHLAGKFDPAPSDPQSGSFRSALVSSLETVNAYQRDHEQLSVRAIVEPESVDPHDITIAAATANLSLSITKNVLDRVIQAYRDITNLR